MRKTRWALLVLLAAAIAVVVTGYLANKTRNLKASAPAPAPLPAELNALSKNWSWSLSSGDRPVVEAKARDFRQIKDSLRIELVQVELKIFSKTGQTYDLVRSEKAEFDESVEKLYSEGEVTILLRLPVASQTPASDKPYVEIHTSGLTYDNKTTVSSTDRPVRFLFEDGEGSSVGALYDSTNRYLWMKNNAEIVRGSGPAKMTIRGGELHYREAEQKIELRPWSSVERGAQGVNAGASLVFLEDEKLKRIEALQGKGWDRSSGRDLQFSGSRLDVDFTPLGTVSTATGMGEAEVVSRSATGATRMNGGRIDLIFTTPARAGENELSFAMLREKARLENVPAVPKDRPQPETRILSAESIEMRMMPGGENVQSINTLTPGQLEFVPNAPGQWKRVLTAERIAAQYTAGNRIEKLNGTGKAHLRSDPPASTAGKPAAARLTWSDNLEAQFDAPSGQVRELRQWPNFRFEEGQRQAWANAARFDIPNDRITLETAARVRDDSGLTTADRMVLDQKQDRFEAEGRVTSTHQDKAPPASTKTSEGLFSSGKPIYAKARRMESRQRNQVIEYIGEARLWQEGNKIEADRIHLDRPSKALSASGKVETVLVESQEKAGTKEKASPGMVTVSADSLAYTDNDRRAYYTGNVRMRRDRMTVRSSELEAFLRSKDRVNAGESQLERAVARKKVEIRETATGQRPSRRANSEQADYFSDGEKVVLRGGIPTVEQPGRGITRGEELTYYIDDDRLLVSGGTGAPAETYQKPQRKE